MGFNYPTGLTPDNYICTRCGAAQVKPWREYNTFVNHTEFVCFKCVAHLYAVIRRTGVLEVICKKCFDELVEKGMSHGRQRST